MARSTARTSALLEHYLSSRPTALVGQRAQGWWALGAVSAIPGAAIGFGTGHVEVVVGALVACVFCVAQTARVKKLDPTPEHQLRLEADAASRAIIAYSRQRKLHRVLHPAMISVMEECAGFWRRVHDAVHSQVWDNPMLPAHWVQTGTQAIEAANQTMDEVLILTHQSITLDNGPVTVAEGVQDVLDSLGVDVRIAKRHQEPLPLSFRQVRDLADKLRQLAREVEDITHDLARATPQHRASADERLDSVLSDLKAIRTAEQELDQNA